MVVVAGTAAGDAMAGFAETAELLDVDVDEFAGMAAAIPVWWLNGLELGELVQADPFQHCGIGSPAS